MRHAQSDTMFAEKAEYRNANRWMPIRLHTYSFIISPTVTYYDATYHGWIDCSYITTQLGEPGETTQA